jgi:hypothetical protein
VRCLSSASRAPGTFPRIPPGHGQCGRLGCGHNHPRGMFEPCWDLLAIWAGLASSPALLVEQDSNEDGSVLDAAEGMRFVAREVDHLNPKKSPLARLLFSVAVFYVGVMWLCGKPAR